MYQAASYQDNKMFRTFAVSSTGMWGSETKEVLGPMADSYAEGHFIPRSVAIAGIKRSLQVAQMKIMAQHIRQSFDRVEVAARRCVNRAARADASDSGSADV